MTTDQAPDPASPDPVNRWATEHYGFEEPPGAQPGDPYSPDVHPTTSAADPRPVPAPGPASPRRTGWIVGGIVSLALIAGLGGVSVAAAAVGDDGGRGGPAGGDRGVVVRFDDRGGRADGGRR